MNKFRMRFSFTILKREIEGYGFKFSFKSYLKMLLIMFVLVISTCLLYQLEIVFVIYLILLCVYMIPGLFRSQYRYLYEQKRFHDVILYLEQMINSISKDPKIILALKDTEKILDGRIKEIVKEMIKHIEQGYSDHNVYEEAFLLLENEYDCNRITSLHNFLLKIENEGGFYHNSIRVIREDIQAWTERTFLFQKERKAAKRDFNISLVSSFFMSVMVLVINHFIEITNRIEYQLGATIYMSSCIICFNLIQKKFNGSWLANSIPDYVVEKNYRIAVYFNPKSSRRKFLLLYVALILITGLFLCYKFFLFSFVSGMILILLYIHPTIKKSDAVNRTKTYITTGFPEWIRDVALNLQFHTVQISIEKTLETAPKVLQEPIRQLIDEMEEEPSGLDPYYNFLKEFKMLEINSVMKMLYSMTETGYEETDQNINAIISRNYKLIDKSEKIRNKISLESFALTSYIPLFFGVIKICIDIILVITIYMELVGSIQSSVGL